MSDIRKLREAVNALADISTAELGDEAWYDKLWELLDPVIDARAERQFTAAVNAVASKTRDAERCPVTWNPGVWPYTTRCVLNANHNNYLHHDRHGNTFTRNQPPTHDAGEYRDPSTGEVDVEAHRFTFEGSTGLLARHLIHDHGVPPRSVVHWSGGLTRGDWVTLDDLHRKAHEH